MGDTLCPRHSLSFFHSASIISSNSGSTRGKGSHSAAVSFLLEHKSASASRRSRKSRAGGAVFKSTEQLGPRQ
ncbi:hypothetical protein SUVZ_07G2760 [Saccharomyces uvarum]|uniref:Uncharacterized protein n=1 Tax=Saccharomyces uvarum TaxID=230603 RepID=A0ABN8WUI6_SACUV|nr:hypothetical protein SUVZ_07G2760 [Saccharomyces uvarum]